MRRLIKTDVGRVTWFCLPGYSSSFIRSRRASRMPCVYFWLDSRSSIVLLACRRLARRADEKSRQKGWMLDWREARVPRVAGSAFLAFCKS